MLKLTSLVSEAIELEWDDQSYPDRVLIRSGEFSYTVFPSERIMTNGDLEAARRLAAPCVHSDGAVMRIAAVYDPILADNYGFEGNRAYFVRVLSVSEQVHNRLKVGSYYELGTVGWGTEIDTQEPSDPNFQTIWFDACDVMPDQPEPGRIFVRGFVETTDARYSPVDEFVFIGNELADYSASAQLIERHWARYGAADLVGFEQAPMPGLAIPRENGFNLADNAGYTEKVEIRHNELTDTYRLHSQKSVRLECVEEMCADVKALVAVKRIPDFLRDEAVIRRENAYIPAMAMTI